LPSLGRHRNKPGFVKSRSLIGLAVGLAGGSAAWQAVDLRKPTRPAMKIERIDHLNITVADIDRSVEFYKRVLGMEIESMGEGRAALHFGQQKIHLDAAGGAMAMSGEKRMPAHICFITEAPMGEVAAHLEQCGVPVRMQGPRAGAIGTIQSVYIDDPDQNSIEISSY
jgi:catechol 2,3-dioxygenase-like lactoylglutathione lyase family enzyme